MKYFSLTAGVISLLIGFYLFASYNFYYWLDFGFICLYLWYQWYRYLFSSNQ